jgi:polygalacturonase
MFGLLCLSWAATDPWDEVAGIESTIRAPVFPSAEFNILRYGAIADDAAKLNYEAINKAIRECSSSGGGTVLVPKGTFHTGPLVLKSNVNLHLQAGARLLFTTDVQYFYPAVLTRWEGNDCYNAAPLIYAYGCTSIAITGSGSIDGGASNDNWWPMSGKMNYG